MKTIEDFLLYKVEKAENQYQLYNVVDEIKDEIMNTDERLYSIKLEMSGYGTYKVKLWLNEYHFGDELKRRLEKHYLITHDRYREYKIEDLEEIIDNVLSEFAYENW